MKMKMNINKTLAIVTSLVLISSLLSTPAYSFEVDSIELTLQDAQTFEFTDYDILTAIFSIFNNGTQTVELSTHNMLYLNDTNSYFWEYTSHWDLDSFSSTDCPILNSTISAGQSVDVKLCYLLPKDNSTGYSAVINNHKYFMEWDPKEFVLEDIPGWFTTVAGSWCSDIISESEFSNSVETYIQQGSIKVLRTQSGTDTGLQTPSWVKQSACDWSADQISQYEFLDGIYWLIDNGKIQL